MCVSIYVSIYVSKYVTMYVSLLVYICVFMRVPIYESDEPLHFFTQGGNAGGGEDGQTGKCYASQSGGKQMKRNFRPRWVTFEFN